MRKSTILMIAVVFIASILIVGIFGMKIFTIGKVNYVKEIVVSQDSFTIDNTEAQANFKVVESSDGKKYSYLIIVKPNTTVNLTINPTLIPTLDDMELTNPEITTIFEHNNPENAKTTFSDGVFTMSSAVNGADSFMATLKTNDGSNLRLSITVMVVFRA